MQLCAGQFCAVHIFTVQFCAVQFHAVQLYTVQLCAVQFHAVVCSTVLDSSVQYNSVQWCLPTADPVTAADKELRGKSSLAPAATCPHLRHVCTSAMSAPPTCLHLRHVCTSDLSTPPTCLHLYLYSTGLVHTVLVLVHTSDDVLYFSTPPILY